MPVDALTSSFVKPSSWMLLPRDHMASMPRTSMGYASTFSQYTVECQPGHPWDMLQHSASTQWNVSQDIHGICCNIQPVHGGMSARTSMGYAATFSQYRVECQSGHPWDMLQHSASTGWNVSQDIHGICFNTQSVQGGMSARTSMGYASTLSQYRVECQSGHPWDMLQHSASTQWNVSQDIHGICCNIQPVHSGMSARTSMGYASTLSQYTVECQPGHPWDMLQHSASTQWNVSQDIHGICFNIQPVHSRMSARTSMGYASTFSQYRVECQSGHPWDMLQHSASTQWNVSQDIHGICFNTQPVHGGMLVNKSHAS